MADKTDPMGQDDESFLLVDVSTTSISDLVRDVRPGSALARSLKGLLDGLNDPHGVISGFGNIP